jgi:hypothetical protein
MIKKTLLPALVTLLTATSAFGILIWRDNNLSQGCRFERYLFPLYQTSENTYFVPIWSQTGGLKLQVVEAPLQDQKNINGVWQSYNEIIENKDNRSYKLIQEETNKNTALLDKSQLVDFAVFLYCEWNKYYQQEEYSHLTPYLLSNSTLVDQLQNAKPYFDILKPKTAELRNFGVSFRTTPAKAVVLEEALVKAFEHDREVKNAAKEEAKKVKEAQNGTKNEL